MFMSVYIYTHPPLQSSTTTCRIAQSLGTPFPLLVNVIKKLNAPYQGENMSGNNGETVFILIFKNSLFLKTLPLKHKTEKNSFSPR